MPPEVVVSGFAEDSLVLAKLGEGGGSLRAEGGGRAGKEIDERADGDQAAGGVEPLGFGEMERPLGIAGALLKKKGHGVFVCGKEFEQRTHFEAFGEAFQRIFITSEGVAVDKDVKAGIFPFDNYIKACCHLKPSLALPTLRGQRKEVAVIRPITRVPQELHKCNQKFRGLRRERAL
jgi:hypothetical protein